MQGSINFDGSLIGNITGGGGGGGSEVVITPVLTSGTKITDVTVDGEDKDLFAPTPTPPTPATEVSVTQTLASGTKIGSIEVDGESTDLFAPTPTPPTPATEVTVSQVLTEGTKIASIEVDGDSTDIYAPAGGGGCSFSETEQVVGTWIDGKPLYQKTVVSTATPSQNNWTTINLNIPSDAVICRYEGYYRRIPNKTDFILQYNPTGSNEWIFGAMSNNNFVYKVGNPYVANFQETYITVWYTKATD